MQLNLKNLLVTCCLATAFLSGYGQSVNIDSLKSVLDNSELSDTTRINILIKLASQYKSKDPYTAMQYGNEGLKLSKKIDFKRGITRTLKSIGNIYNKQGNYEEAMEYFKQALHLNKEIGHRLGIASCLGNIGIVYQHKGDYEKAIDHYLQSIKLYRQIGYTKGVGINLNNLGNTYVMRREYKMAVDYYVKSYKIKEEASDKRGMAYSLNNIGTVYYFTEDYAKAIEYFSRSLEINKELGDLSGIASCTQNIGDTYFKLGNYNITIKYYEEAMKMAEGLGDKRSIAQLLHNMGKLHWKIDKDPKAVEYLEKSVEIASEIGAKMDMQNAYKELSYVHEELKDYRKAYQYYQLYSQTKDSLFNEEKSKEIGKLEARYEFETKQEENKRLVIEELRLENVNKQRRDNLQYTGILIFIVLLFAVVFGLGRLSLPIRLAEGMVFFTFLLFFEFTLVLLDPFIEQYSAGAPAIKLGFNAVLAGLIFPLHSFFETKLKKRVIK